MMSAVDGCRLLFCFCYSSDRLRSLSLAGPHCSERRTPCPSAGPFHRESLEESGFLYHLRTLLPLRPFSPRTRLCRYRSSHNSDAQLRCRRCSRRMCCGPRLFGLILYHRHVACSSSCSRSRRVVFLSRVWGLCSWNLPSECTQSICRWIDRK